MLLAMVLWGALTHFRGGVSTGISKRATAFCVMVFGQIILGAFVLEVAQDASNQFMHRLGAFLVSIGAAWVWLKSREMAGNVRESANVVLMLAVVEMGYSISTPFLISPDWSFLLQQATNISLLSVAVWLAYEMRIYPVR